MKVLAMNTQVTDNTTDNTNSKQTSAETISNNGQKTEKFEYHPDIVSNVAASVADQFVRKSGLFLHVDHLGATINKEVAKSLAAQCTRIKQPKLSKNLQFVKDVVELVFNPDPADAVHSIPQWDNTMSCHPDKSTRLIRGPLMASLNTWRKPNYRNLHAPKADISMLDEFLDQALVQQADKAPLLDWMAWNLQNEADKPGWAPFLYSGHKGTGKSSLTKLWTRLLGAENTLTTNGISALSGRFSVPFALTKGVIVEEIEVNVKHSQWNTMKTFLTEKDGSGERKGVDIKKITKCACVMLTSNN